jgi:hypothetical protein
MKYIITESQLKRLTEDDFWSDERQEKEFNKLCEKMVPLIQKMFSYYHEDDKRINLYNSNRETLLTYVKPSKELYYSRDLGNFLDKLLPHPLWLIFGSGLMKQVFLSFYPEINIKSVRSANIS